MSTYTIDQITSILNAAENLGGIMRNMTDTADTIWTAMTCMEADAFAALLGALGHEEDAVSILEEHGAGDEMDDDHYVWDHKRYHPTPELAVGDVLTLVIDDQIYEWTVVAGFESSLYRFQGEAGADLFVRNADNFDFDITRKDQS